VSEPLLRHRPDITSERPGSTFPSLTPPQVDRVAAHGRRRATTAGEVLVEAGQDVVPFFVVVEGEIEIVQRHGDEETVVAVHGPGQFTGEVNMLASRRSLVTGRVTAPGEVLELTRDELLALVQTDSELSDIIVRAFILRRVELLARGLGDAVVLGSEHCAGTLRVREFLNRNGHPYTYVDLDRDEGVQEMLDRFAIGHGDVPVLICRGELVLRNPSNREIAECLGFNPSLDEAHVVDVVIVGAGPAGLAAAVYAASEGLEALILETEAPGGQAAASSKIENYLGFPTGIPGQELAARAFNQAQKFGAQLLVAMPAQRLACERRPYAVEIEGRPPVSARTVVLASGAQYRKLALADVTRFEGSGVYYGATHMEAQLCKGEDVVVVGGGNSAGQAAVFLANSTRRVRMLVRGAGLAATMSRYLVRRIEGTPNIDLHVRSEIVGLDGDDHLERVRWRDGADGPVRDEPIRHVFLMMGAVPATRWLRGCVALDEKGFVKTGPDLTVEDLALARWPLARRPHLLETSLPGVFAVGDVRAGNVKRVASAVGEGSIAVFFVHQVLRE
jgi:thioredoxin reductase (NADPH)